jgi:hypothetical protein
MDRYGISIGQLGPEFAKQELDKQAAQLLQDFRLLNAAGVSHQDILGGMGTSLNEYVQMSLQAGTSIPEAMRPIIEEMIQNKQLLDENGHAYESVEEAGLSFTQTMTEQFGTLIEKIDALVSALLGIPTNVNSTINIHTNRTNSGGPYNTDGSPDGDGDPFTPLARGFEGMVTSPRKFLVGENGPEYMSVTPAGKAGGMNMAGVESLLRSVDARLARLPETLARTTRDAVLVGRA